MSKDLRSLRKFLDSICFSSISWKHSSKIQQSHIEQFFLKHTDGQTRYCWLKDASRFFQLYKYLRKAATAPVQNYFRRQIKTRTTLNPDKNIKLWIHQRSMVNIYLKGKCFGRESFCDDVSNICRVNKLYLWSSPRKITHLSAAWVCILV